MGNKMKLKRITDLFTEGDVCYLGDDEDQNPICVWVQKNNSIEEEEARLDGQSAKTQILLALADPSHPEVVSAHMTIDTWSDEELFDSASKQKYEECLTKAMDDIEADEEWTEKLEYIRRQPTLLDDAKVAEDDPRRVQLNEYMDEFYKRLDELALGRVDALKAEMQAQGREKTVDDFLQDFKDKYALDHYMIEFRVSKLFFAMRECEAVRAGEEWDHKACDHSKRLMDDRKQVRELPDHVLARLFKSFDELQVGARNVGNFPEPQSSSESSVPPSNVEA